MASQAQHIIAEDDVRSSYSIVRLKVEGAVCIACGDTNINYHYNLLLLSVSWRSN